ncbi:MAG: cell wall biosynthesis protein [Methanobrevibacter sp.]|jgi:hypothetical protein|nr:cell wall biosynthesis protein [Candidatus Methanovirga meridionalis]
MLVISYEYIIIGGIACFLGTIGLTILFRILGQNQLIGNLYADVRGGIPRGIGLIPCIVLSVLLTKSYTLVLTIGFFAFLDDILGRYKPPFLPMELGQLFRGIGMIAVMSMGYESLGYSAILIALMIQPMNISDMQPGSTVSVVIIMSLLSLLLITLIGSPDNINFYQALLVLVCCIAYSPLDYSGRIMMGEVGNHTFAVVLGLVFYSIGGFVTTLLLFMVTTILISFIRRNTLKKFFIDQLKINNPLFGDFVMDVLTGGGLGDLLRKILLGKKQIQVKNPILIILGFRRLLYNPNAKNSYDRLPLNINL